VKRASPAPPNLAPSSGAAVPDHVPRHDDNAGGPEIRCARTGGGDMAAHLARASGLLSELRALPRDHLDGKGTSRGPESVPANFQTTARSPSSPRALSSGESPKAARMPRGGRRGIRPCRRGRVLDRGRDLVGGALSCTRRRGGNRGRGSKRGGNQQVMMAMLLVVLVHRIRLREQVYAKWCAGCHGDNGRVRRGCSPHDPAAARFHGRALPDRSTPAVSCPRRRSDALYR